MADVHPAPAGVIDIPDGALLQGTTFAELQASFTRTWGFAASAVCLPMSTPRTLYFDSTAGYEQQTFPYGREADEYELPGIVTVAAQNDLDVILSTSATAPYTGLGGGDLVDVAGTASRQSCPWNPDMRGLLGDVIAEAMTRCAEALADHG